MTLLLTHDPIYDVETTDIAQLRLGIAAYFARPVATHFATVEHTSQHKRLHDTASYADDKLLALSVRGNVQTSGSSDLWAGQVAHMEREAKARAEREAKERKKQARKRLGKRGKQAKLSKAEKQARTEARIVARLANRKASKSHGEKLVCHADAVAEAWIFSTEKRIPIVNKLCIFAGYSEARKVYTRRGESVNGKPSKRRAEYRQALEALVAAGKGSGVNLAELVDGLPCDLQATALMLAEGFTQTDIAERLGKSQQWISKQVSRIRHIMG